MRTDNTDDSSSIPAQAPGSASALARGTAAPAGAAADTSVAAPPPPARAAALVQRALAAGQDGLGEWESKSLLAAYGVPVPEGALVASEAEARATAERLGGRLAMKAVGAAIQHKTEGGLVVLNVTGGDSAAQTYRLLAERAGAALEGVLIERMISGNRELLVGLKRDPVFGPVVALGLGGVLTEVLADVALALVPPSDRDLAQLPELLRAKRILGPFRGFPAVDRDGLATVVRAVSRLALDFPDICEVDINPLLIEGGRPIAADALVVFGALQAPGSGGEAAPAPASPVRSCGPAVARSTRTFPLDLKAVFAPASVAIVGASDDILKWGGSALRSLLDGGFNGAIYPVNPRGGVFWGIEAYKSIADVPEAPDLALMAVGGRQVKGALEDCGKRGVRAVVVLAAGFSETGSEGAALERELVDIASRYHMTLVGPNCIGLMSNEASFHATGFVKLHPPKGRLSFATQSGSLAAGVVFTCERWDIGLEKFISVGNEAQVSAFDVLDYLRDDPDTKGIMLYLEGIDDGQHFFEAARATTSTKPVIVLRGGITESGGRAAASHTGAMAGSAAVYQAAARQAGVVTCRNVPELVETAACLTYLPLPRGRRVAIVTNGGGPGVLAADEAALHGLQLAPVPPDLIAELDTLLPPFWSRRNPLDCVTSAFGDIGLRVMDLVTRCETVDAVVAFGFIAVPSVLDEGREKLVCGEYNGFNAWELSWMKRIHALMEETGKPIIPVPAGPIYGSHLDFGGRYRPVLLSSAGSAMRALDRMDWYRTFRAGGGADQG